MRKNIVKLIALCIVIIPISGIYSVEINDASDNSEMSELDKYSENEKLYINDIVFSGNNFLTQKELFALSGFDKEIGIFVREIRSGIDKLYKSGYFSSVTYWVDFRDKKIIYIALKENPPLASLKVVDSRMLDLTVFKKKLQQKNVVPDKVFSTVVLEKAIDEFNIYNQNYGLFLYHITYRVVTREEILKTGGEFLYDKSELQKSGVHVVVTIKDIPELTINKIRMKGVSVAYDKILSYIKLSQVMKVSSDNDLFFSYKRMKKLGFYEKVYFKLIPSIGNIYNLEIIADEISLSEVTSSITAPSNIGVIMNAEYYNIAVASTLQRMRFGAGWEIQPGKPVFVAEYTHPYFLDGLFLDAMFTKSDSAVSIKNSTDMVMRSTYEGKLTSGINIVSNFFSYLYHKESYIDQMTVDNEFKQKKEYKKKNDIQHASGLMLVFDDVDDNFFITQGYKIVGDYEVTWKKNLAYKTGLSGEIYVPVPFFNLIAAVNSRGNVLVAKKSDKDSTLQVDDRMRTSVQEIKYIGEEQIKMTSYSSAEIRFPLPQGIDYLEDMSFVIFGEAGGAWADYKGLSLQETRFGFGVGLRLSPRRHYSSFLFKFPAGLYLGYRIGDSKAKATLVSHRDSTYYISLSASY